VLNAKTITLLAAVAGLAPNADVLHALRAAAGKKR
jgi:hypothetical protein